MGIYTRKSIVILSERAAFCLIKIHKKISILLVKSVVMDQLNSDFLFIMGKIAIMAILAFMDVIWIITTELFFDSIFVIKLFDLIMTVLALITILTISSIGTFLKGVNVILGSSLV